MSGNQHPKSRQPTDRDLKSNPGIGQTRSVAEGDDSFEDEEGGSTVEGDVLNDTRRDGSLNPRQRGRTNK